VACNAQDVNQKAGTTFSGLWTRERTEMAAVSVDVGLQRREDGVRTARGSILGESGRKVPVL
jgi:hypothetical protein